MNYIVWTGQSPVPQHSLMQILGQKDGISWPYIVGPEYIFIACLNEWANESYTSCMQNLEGNIAYYLDTYIKYLEALIQKYDSRTNMNVNSAIASRNIWQFSIVRTSYLRFISWELKMSPSSLWSPTVS